MKSCVDNLSTIPCMRNCAEGLISSVNIFSLILIVLVDFSKSAYNDKWEAKEIKVIKSVLTAQSRDFLPSILLPLL
jgi:hypothetical protein